MLRPPVGMDLEYTLINFNVHHGKKIHLMGWAGQSGSALGPELNMTHNGWVASEVDLWISGESKHY